MMGGMQYHLTLKNYSSLKQKERHTGVLLIEYHIMYSSTIIVQSSNKTQVLKTTQCFKAYIVLESYSSFVSKRA